MIVNVRALESWLQEAGVPEAYYCLNGEQHESLCLLSEDGYWRVFLSERGSRYEEQRFSSEDKACEYFQIRIRELWRP